jgi:hypothetical protein
VNPWFLRLGSHGYRYSVQIGTHHVTSMTCNCSFMGFGLLQCLHLLSAWFNFAHCPTSMWPRHQSMPHNVEATLVYGGQEGWYEAGKSRRRNGTKVSDHLPISHLKHWPQTDAHAPVRHPGYKILLRFPKCSRIHNARVVGQVNGFGPKHSFISSEMVEKGRDDQQSEGHKCYAYQQADVWDSLASRVLNAH